MIRRYLIVGFVTLSFTFVFGQSDDVKQWISNNPAVNFINERNLSNFSSSDLNLMDGNYIVFNGELTEKDIADFDPAFLDKKENNTLNQTSANANFDQASFVKFWLSKHQHVKIVKRSEFNAVDQASRQEYLANGCLILMGEVLTKKDIELFQP